MSLMGVTMDLVSDIHSINGTTDPLVWNNQSNVTEQQDVESALNNNDLSAGLTDDLIFALECITMPIIVVVGVTGNILSLVVLLHKKLRRSSTTTLLIGLTISDSLFLITTMARKSTCIIKRFDELVSYKFYITSFPAGFFLNTCFSRVSTLLVAVMSVNRLIAVTVPLKFKFLCTKTRMAIVVVIVYAFTFGLLALLPVQLDIKYRNGTPYIKDSKFLSDNQDFFDIYNRYIIVIGFRWIPKIIVVMCNGIIIALLLKRRVPSDNTQNTSTMTTRASTQRKVTVMLVTVAIVFVVTLLPGDAFVIASLIMDGFSLYGKYSNYFMVLSDATLTFELINSSVNFVIYMVLSSSFADVYLLIFCPCPSTAQQTTQIHPPRRKRLCSVPIEEEEERLENIPSVSGTIHRQRQLVT